MTPDQQCEAVRAALAEDGYEAIVEWQGGTWPGPSLIECSPIPSQATYWRACAVTWTPECQSAPMPCWPCMDAKRYRDCTHDFRTEPWPELERVS